MEKLEKIKAEIIRYKKTFNKYKKLLEQDDNISEEEQNQLNRLEGSLQIAALLVENKKLQNQSKEAKSIACYILTVTDSELSPITLSDGTIIGYKAERVIRRIEIDCKERKHQYIFNVYEQNQGVLASDEVPKMINKKQDSPFDFKRRCDFEEAKKYFLENPEQTTFTPTEPLIWYKNVQTIGNSDRDVQRVSEDKNIEFERGNFPFKNPNQAKQDILQMLDGVPPNGVTATPWTTISTTSELDSEGNTVTVLLQTQVQTQTRSIVSIVILTSLTTPSAMMGGLGITNSELMDKRLGNIGKVLVGAKNLRNNDVQRGKANGSVKGIVWNASSQLRQGRPNLVQLSRATTTTTTTVEQKIISPSKPIVECP